MPVGAYGGRPDVMGRVSPVGPVYQAGTLSGNPLAMACGIATLKVLKRTNPYPPAGIGDLALARGLAQAADSGRHPARCRAVGSMFTFFSTRKRS